MKSVETLKQRFERFVRTLRGYENIDDLLLKAPPEELQRADYLIWNREFVIEQKSLDSDPHCKVETFVQELVHSRNMLVYGRVGFEALIRDLPDRDLIRKALYDSVSKGGGAIVEKADRQTRDTRRIFDIPDASGVLIVLNEVASSLDPDILAFKFNEMLNKKREGKLRDTSNGAVVLISETHLIRSNQVSVFPCVTVTAPGQVGNVKLQEFLRNLLQAWAQFNGVPLVQGSVPLDQFRQKTPKPVSTQR